jgi:hypothetical protein
MLDGKILKENPDAKEETLEEEIKEVLEETLENKEVDQSKVVIAENEDDKVPHDTEDKN